MNTRHGILLVCTALITTACSESASSIVGSKFSGPDCGYEAIEFRDDGNACFILPRGAGSGGKSKQVSGTYKVAGDRVIVTGRTGELEMTWRGDDLSYETGPRKGTCIRLE
jgi:hypothetical protein